MPCMPEPHRPRCPKCGAADLLEVVDATVARRVVDLGEDGRTQLAPIALDDITVDEQPWWHCAACQTRFTAPEELRPPGT